MKYEIIPIKQYKNNMKTKLVYVGKIEKILALLTIDKLFQGNKKLTLKEYLDKYGNLAYYKKVR